MSLLVLAYPKIEKQDYEWIQNIRSKEDERFYDVVEPHFTLVFPVSNINQEVFINHVQKVSKKYGTFYFALRCAQIVKDSFSNYTDVFLVPEEGYRIFIKLHDALYTGPLEEELRLDIPFIPHIGIANHKDARKCKELADRINTQNPEIIGAINKLSIVSYENDKVLNLTDVFLR